jgi:hypothetical protein
LIELGVISRLSQEYRVRNDHFRGQGESDPIISPGYFP